MIDSQSQYLPSTRDEGPRTCRVRRESIAALLACVGVLIASCSSTTEPTTPTPSASATTSSAPKNSALKTIDPQAFKAVVEDAAEQLKVPGAMVLLRTPQGQFNAAVGTTELGAQTPPAANRNFRIASITNTMTSALTVVLAQDV